MTSENPPRLPEEHLAPEKPGYTEHNRTELRALVAKLDQFTNRAWFKDFARIVMTPAILTAEAWDQLTRRDRSDSPTDHK